MSRETMRTVAVVLAGGVGSRSGLGIPKQFMKVAGKTVIEHSLDKLQGSPTIDQIVVAISEDYKLEFSKFVEGRYSKISHVVSGGRDRKESTWSAISSFGSEECKVLIHDAVRPFLTNEIIARCAEALNEFDAVDVVIESADTIVQVDSEGVLCDIPKRSTLRRTQTPQGFMLSVIRRAHEIGRVEGTDFASEDCGVVMKYLPDVPIKALYGTHHNTKITYPVDAFLAERLFEFASMEAADAAPLSELGQKIKGKSIVVFGGSYGIGSTLVKVGRDLGAEMYTFNKAETGTDPTDPSSIHDALQSVVRQVGRVDCVVSMAALCTRAPLIEMSPLGIQEQIEVNFVGPAMIAREALPYLAKSQGHLLLFTSSSHNRGRAEYSLYSSTKSAVANMAQALSDEWSTLGVKVNCLSPERTLTPLRLKNFGYEPEETLHSADAVAQSALHVLASDMTGSIIDVRRFGQEPLLS